MQDQTNIEDHSNNGWTESTPAELAQQTTRQVTQPKPRPDETGTDDQQPPQRRGHRPTAAIPGADNDAKPARRTRKPTAAATSDGLRSQAQIGMDDEYLDEELTGAVRDMLDKYEEVDEVWNSDAARPFRDAAKLRTGLKSDISAALPRDGKAHQYRVDGYLVSVGLPSEEKTMTRRSRQPISFKKLEA